MASGYKYIPVLILALSEIHTSRSSLDNPRIVCAKVKSEFVPTILGLSEFIYHEPWIVGVFVHIRRDKD